MDRTTALNALSKLVSNYPQLSTATVEDVMEQCDQDPVRTYDILCEMVMPSHLLSTTSTETQSQNEHEQTISPMSADNIDNTMTTMPNITTTTTTTSLQGAWARENIGRRYRVDSLCATYPWLQRPVVHALCDKYSDCLDLIEADILQMYPIDEPASYATPKSNTSKFQTQTTTTFNKTSTSTSTTLEKQQQYHDEIQAELYREAHPLPDLHMRCPTLNKLRAQVWQWRESALCANALAAQTRKPALIAEAKRKMDQLHRLSTYLLDRIQHTVEFQHGYIDLHGLTRDEALQLVDIKLQQHNHDFLNSTSSNNNNNNSINNNNNDYDDDDGGGGGFNNNGATSTTAKKFTLITGKGNNSLNGQAVLKPAIEKHLRKRGVHFSSSSDGVITVTPRVHYVRPT